MASYVVCFYALIRSKKRHGRGEGKLSEYSFKFLYLRIRKKRGVLGLDICGDKIGKRERWPKEVV